MTSLGRIVSKRIQYRWYTFNNWHTGVSPGMNHNVMIVLAVLENENNGNKISD